MQSHSSTELLDRPSQFEAPAALRYIPQIDGLRAFAFLAVFVHNAFQAPMLWTGVDLFFVISGFLITGILLSIKTAQPGAFFRAFYIRRVFRILPPYFFALALTYLLFHIQVAGTWYWYAFFAANIGHGFEILPRNALSHTWSLAVEEQFYLTWPLALFFLRGRTVVALLAGVIITAPIPRGFFTFYVPESFVIYTQTPFRADLLSAGCLVFLAWRRGWLERFRPAAMGLMLWAAAAFLVLTLRPEFRGGANSVLFNVLGYSLSTCFFTSLFVYVVTGSNGLLHTVLTNRTLRYLGSISYMMYLLHKPALALANRYVHTSLLIQATLALAATVAMSSLTWHFGEKQLMQMGKRLTRNLGTPQVAPASVGI
jgi:peptidoglycan/LPS O-acetylase OafA/YrhL